MPLYAVGMNAKTHHVDEREAFALLDQQIVRRNQKLIDEGLVDEIVTLSTCNRIEHYFVSDNSLDEMTRVLFGENPPENLIQLKDTEVSYHLFQVSAGLDSQILGENEILGQLKRAYFLAQENNLTGKHMNVLFQKGIYVGKRVRTMTDISKCSVSTGGIILDKIKHHFEKLENLKVLLIGAGEISRVVATSLYHKGVRDIRISNRSQETGMALAHEMNAVYIPLDKLYDNIKEADVVISSTTAPHYLITKTHEEYLKGDHKLLIDLAVPRDIEPDVNDFENIDLINIDSISTLSNLNQNKRQEATDKANDIIALENCHFCLKRLHVDRSPVTLSFFDFEELYRKEKSAR
ncbi:MAG: glutamyl-tRNA reductase [Spirochaetota bacterium]|nr:glutamyl-tRNA reductase [Spirochaetota bacterium]